ncbi:MAG TPA: hypothetical protein VGI50_12810 [Solirubrobacteraceae bacterium]
MQTQEPEHAFGVVDVGDRANPLRTASEMREGGDVEPLAGGRLADPIVVELLVEVRLDHRLCCLDILESYRRLVVLAPDAPAILPKKERIALGEFGHASELRM